MHIQQEDNSERGSFYIEENAKRVAELAYTWRSKDVASIDHTEVDEKYEGKGLGKLLVDHIVSFAKETDIKLLVYCPFAKTVFEKHKDYQDVMDIY